MKRIGIFGVCLVAACALSVVMVGSASATIAPEIGRCINVEAEVPSKIGAYKNAGCTIKAKETEPIEHKYEWFPGFPPNKAKNGEERYLSGKALEFKSHMTSTLATLEGEPPPGKE